MPADHIRPVAPPPVTLADTAIPPKGPVGRPGKVGAVAAVTAVPRPEVVVGPEVVVSPGHVEPARLAGKAAGRPGHSLLVAVVAPVTVPLVT